MIGQRFLQSRIHSMVRLEKLPRFIIFVGEYGSGRRTFTKWLAEDLNADFIEVQKSVEDVRNVIAQSYSLSDVTLYFIPDADQLSSAAKSALLKVTEEPPKNAYFVLSTTDTERLLPTLTSRASVFNMESYTVSEVAEFVGDDANTETYSMYCNNCYEVQLVKEYGVATFSEFVNLVVDNIADVTGCNALKMENKIAFKQEDKGYDVKVFLQAFRAECMRRIMGIEDKTERLKYIHWVIITSDKLQEIQVQSINKQSVFDMWIFDIREAAYAEG